MKHLTAGGLGALMILLAGNPAHAAVFTVTHSNDSGTGSFRQAMMDANTAPGADTITFDIAGHFSVPRAIVLNSPIPLSGNLTITAPPLTQNRVALRGAAAGTRLFSPGGASVTLTMTDLVMEDARAAGGNGGIMTADAATSVILTAERCQFNDCAADGAGGLFRLVGGVVTFQDCVFADNKAAGSSLLHVEAGSITIEGGSAVRNESTGFVELTGSLLSIGRGFLTLRNWAVSDTPAVTRELIHAGVYTGDSATRGIVTVSMDGCSFTGNQTDVLASEGGPITVTNSTFLRNHSLLNGSFFADPITLRGCTFTENAGLSAGHGPVVVEDCMVENNTGSFENGSGGQSNAPAMTLRRVEFRNNTALPHSGGTLTLEDCILNQNAGTLGRGSTSSSISDITLRRCALTNNTGAATAYEIPNLLADGSPAWLVGRRVTMESCTAHGNSGVLQSLQAAAILNCTFSNNNGEAVIVNRDGAVEDGEGLTVQNSVFSDNIITHPGGAVFQSLGGIRSTGGNFIHATSTIDWTTPAGPGDQIGTPASPLNAMLGPLSTWGGAGRSRMPLAGSPLIDGGHLVPAPPDYQEPLLDQTGRPRVTGTRVDIGAVEGINRFTVSNANNSGPGSLRKAITDAAAVLTAEIVFDPVVFATPRTITLASPLSISSSLTISGPVGGVALSGGDLVRVMELTGTSPQAVLERLHFTQGNVTGDGAGLSMTTGPGGLLTLRECLFSRNNAVGQGGGLAVSGGTVKATNCLWTNNTATLTGGGAAVAGPGVGDFTNCTLAENEADRGGGGFLADGAQVTLIHVTVTDNAADSDGNDNGNGGGLRVIGTALPLRLGNSVVAGNTDASSGGGAVLHPDISGAFTTLGHNFIGKAEGQSGGTPLVHGTAGDQAGTMAAPLNPNLTALAQNGGLLRSRKPGTGSPLINAGDAALLVHAAWPDPPVYDARVQFRSIGAAPDIGAVETPDLVYVQFFAETLPQSAVEGQTGPEGRFLLRRSRPGTDLDVTLARSPASTASAGDFTVGGAAVLPLGPEVWQAAFEETELEKTVLVTPLDDVVDEPDETVILLASPTADYLVQTAAQASRTTTIKSNELVVTTTADHGTGSLREVLARAAPWPETTIIFDPVVFATARTITLSSPIIHNLSDGLRTVHGPPVPLTISGGGTTQLFSLNRGRLVVENLTLADGYGTLPDSIDLPGLSALTVGGSTAATLVLRNCCLRHNRSRGGGGAVNVQPGSFFEAENCTFSQNEALRHGGAIYGWPESTVTLTHCTLAENHADTDRSGDGEGGAIHMAAKDNVVYLTDATLRIQGCLVALNTDQLSYAETSYQTRARHIALPNPVTKLFNSGGNFFSTPFDQGFLPGKDVIPGSGNWTPNAAGLVHPLAWNGGPTMTYALTATGMARMASNPTHRPFDQRGVKRDNISDAGAFSLSPEPYLFWAGYTMPPGGPGTSELDDYDEDGTVNLLEQYCGTDPANGSSFPEISIQACLLPGAVPGDLPDYAVVLSYPFSHRVAPGRLKIFRSTTLAGWQPVTETYSDGGFRDGQFWQTLSYYPGTVERYDPRAWFRLQVQVP